MTTKSPRAGVAGSVTVKAPPVVLQKLPLSIAAVNPEVLTVVFHAIVFGIVVDALVIAVPVSAGNVIVFDPETAGAWTVT
jgi:hypothetical protein